MESRNRPRRAGPTTHPVRLAEALGPAVQSSDLVDITISFRRRADDASGQPASSYTADPLQQIAALLEDLDADQRATVGPTRLAASAGAENQALEQTAEGSKISGLKGKVTYGSVIAALGLCGQFGGYTLHDALAAGERPSALPPAQHGHRANDLGKLPSGTELLQVGAIKPLKSWDQVDTRDLGPIKLFVNGSEMKWGDEGEHSDAVEEDRAGRSGTDDPGQGRPSDLPPEVEVKVTLPDGTEIAADVPPSVLPNR